MNGAAARAVARGKELIERLRRIDLSPRAKKWLAWIGYPAFGLFVALTTLWASVRVDRVKDRLETVLSADVTSGQPLALGMDVSIGELSLTLLTGAGFRANDIVLRTRPVNPADKPARFIIDDLRVRLSLLSTLFGSPSYRFKGHALSGTVIGRESGNADQSKLELQIDKLALGSAPGLQQLMGLPLEGVLSGSLDVVAPKNLLANASGNIDIALDGAAVGDGKAKLTVPNDPFLSAGITFPRVSLGRLSGQIVIDKGRARFEAVRVHSADVDATLDGYVELHDPIGTSQVHAYIKFRPSEALTKREPTIELVNNALSATGRRPDGYLGIQLNGMLSAIVPLPSKDPPFGVTTRNEPVASTASAPPPPSLPSPSPPPPSPLPVTPPPSAPPAEPAAPAVPPNPSPTFPSIPPPASAGGSNAGGAGGPPSGAGVPAPGPPSGPNTPGGAGGGGAGPSSPGSGSPGPGGPSGSTAGPPAGVGMVNPPPGAAPPSGLAPGAPGTGVGGAGEGPREVAPPPAPATPRGGARVREEPAEAPRNE